MIETEIYSYLSAYAGLIALIGDRIYPLKAVQEVTCPYVVFFKVSNIRQHSHDGFSTLQKSRYQCSCYATRYFTSGSTIGAKNVAEKVIEALEAWSSSTIKAVIPEDDKDLLDPATGLYHVPVDVMIWYGA